MITHLVHSSVTGTWNHRCSVTVGRGRAAGLEKRKKRGGKKPASRLVICAILEIDL
jgi:hypothetical protein